MNLHCGRITYNNFGPQKGPSSLSRILAQQKAIMKELRVCRICLVEKPSSEFPDNNRKKAVENRCKECINTHASFRNKLKKVSPPKPDRCECCNKITDKLCIDHCHDTLEFRGWLCAQCNRGIGQLGDNIEGLERALRYLNCSLPEKRVDIEENGV